MLNYSILDIPTVLHPPFKLKDVIYNCPICDNEIFMDIVVFDNTSVKCENCNHKIILKIKSI